MIPVSDALYAPNSGEKIEHAITRLLIDELKIALFVPIAVFDGEEYQIAGGKTLPRNTRATPASSMTDAEVLDAVFSVSDCTLHFAPIENLEGWGVFGVRLICGNADDFITDWHLAPGVPRFAQAVERVQDQIEHRALVIVPATQVRA